ncbi:CD209 antigen-like protein C isoform X2 [Suncus etruscus]|uniref:CD209 antigen-like protein C isoform X2 n=1 Tax=Suncus etruscus TaxID=109475 RepID=UPI002110992A|nr:CD209 antigen-like protein C isoform X2 [Suncus etruscus]
MDKMFNPKAAGGGRGRLPKVSFGLLQLLVSLTFFLLLVIVLIKVSTVHQSVQNQTEELQQKCILNETSGMEKVEAPQKQIQAIAHPELDVLRQYLAWMNVTLERLCRPCPWDWEFFLGSCYWFSKSLNNWKSSMSACELLNAQLVVINSEAEEKFLQSWEARHKKRTWIGLSDHQNEGSWRWVDNTPIELSYWKQGEPNNDEDEDCVELYNDGWNDDKCNQEKVWICEKTAVPCPAL